MTESRAGHWTGPREDLAPELRSAWSCLHCMAPLAGRRVWHDDARSDQLLGVGHEPWLTAQFCSVECAGAFVGLSAGSASSPAKPASCWVARPGGACAKCGWRHPAQIAVVLPTGVLASTSGNEPAAMVFTCPECGWLRGERAERASSY